jgi:hypothetical protein
MHFWIDKRSSYGIGHNRSMGGVTYQHRRIRSKSIVTPVRQHPPPCVPSTSHQHVKSHHQRNRPAEHTADRPRTLHSSSTEIPAPISNAPALHAQYVPVIHSVYPRDELPLTHVVDSIESSRSLTNHWLPIYLKGGICVAMAIVLVTLKLYYDNDLNGFQLITFGSMSIVIVIFTVTISFLRSRKSQVLRNQRDVNDNFTELMIEPMMSNQIIVQSIDESVEPPPPYAVALSFPEKQSVYESPPPSYEKINII